MGSNRTLLKTCCLVPDFTYIGDLLHLDSSLGSVSPNTFKQSKREMYENAALNALLMYDHSAVDCECECFTSSLMWLLTAKGLTAERQTENLKDCNQIYVLDTET